MLRKKVVYTNITPIPSHIPRQLAVDILHSHGEIITLNPLVLGYEPVKAPRDAEADEFYSTWYEIEERLQYVPGMGKLGSGLIKFKGCFHDIGNGLQTHIYAPAGVDMRNKYQICGNQPGEPAQVRELGIGAPADGLYLREDIEIKCNFTLVSFVKAQAKAAAKVLVERFIKKAELLDAGVLSAMMENGRLKTINPADRTSTVPPQPSPTGVPQHPMSPTQAYTVPRLPSSPGHAPPGGMTYGDQYGQQFGQLPLQQQVQYQHQQQQHAAPMELPGDMYHPQSISNQSTPEMGHLHPHFGGQIRPQSTSSTYYSQASPTTNSRWSDYHSQSSSRPESLASDASGMKSPGLQQAGFASELPAMQESQEEHAEGRTGALKKLEAHRGQTPEPPPKYNPADYANHPAFRTSPS